MKQPSIFVMAARPACPTVAIRQGLKLGGLSIFWSMLAILVFLAAGVLAQERPAGPGEELGVLLDGVVAIVGDEVVTRSELSDAMVYKAALLQARREAGLSAREVEREFVKLEEEIRDNLVDNKLILLAAKEEGINVDDEVRRRIEKLKNSFGGDTEKMNKYLAMQGFNSLDDYQHQMTEELLRQRVVFSFVRPKSEVSRKELEGSYQERYGRGAEGCAGAAVKHYALEQVMFPLGEDASYKEVIASYTAAWKCRARLTDETLDAAAVEEQCAWNGHKPQAGSLGNVDETASFDPAFQAAFDELKSKPAGSWSEPFIMKDGVRLLLISGFSFVCVEDPEEIQRLKDRLKARLEEEKFRRVLKWWLQELRSKYRVDLKKLR